MDDIAIAFLLGLLLLSPLVVLIILIVKVSQVGTRMKHAETRLDELRARLDALQAGSAGSAAPAATEKKMVVSDIPASATAAAAGTTASPTISVDATRSEAVSTAAAQPAVPAESPSTTPAATPEGAPPTAPAGLRPPPRVDKAPLPTRPPKAAPAPAKTKAEWESLIGGRWLNRIGAVALIIAVGFFLNYAFDRNWISETVRVLLGGAAGLGLLAAGWRFEKRGYQVFAQGLLGSGIAILYLSVYASFNFYHLVPQIGAFVLMSLVTALTLYLAVHYDSLAVSLLGLAGGFLTPVMLNTGVANEVGLFTYIALLNAGVIAVLLRKDAWIVLEPISLLATYLTYIAWYDTYYTHPDFGATLFFLVLFWGLFFVMETVTATRPPTKDTPIRHFIAATNAGFFAALLHTLTSTTYDAWSGLALLLAGLCYLAAFFAVRERVPEQADTHARILVTGAAFIVLATGTQFDSFRLITAWSVEAWALTWIGLRFQRRHLWVGGLALYAVAFFTLLGTNGSMIWTDMPKYTFLINERTMAFTALAAALCLSYLGWRQSPEKASRHAAPAMLYGFSLVVFLLLTSELSDLFRSYMEAREWAMIQGIAYQLTVSIAALWAVLAVLYAAAARYARAPQLLHAGLIAMVLSLCIAFTRGIAYDPVSWHTPLFNPRLAAMLVVLLAVAALPRLLPAADRARWIEQTHTSLRVVFVLLLLTLITAEVRDFFELRLFTLAAQGPGAEVTRMIEQLGNEKQLSLSGVWLFFSIVLMTFGLLRGRRVMRVVAFVLFGISILKIFIYDLSYLETLYRIISFAALGLILLLVSFLFQRYKDVIFGEEEARSEKREEGKEKVEEAS
ncbi:MAG: DUF2339 domain-containing protein [Ignavibacteriae bacterium]|nr:DUF2339 domain-containing protein [Ignavibacteriota bacterium]